VFASSASSRSEVESQLADWLGVRESRVSRRLPPASCAFAAVACVVPWLAATHTLASAVCEHAPLAYLVSHPDSCDGTRVEVTGYLTYRSGSPVIWLSQEDAEYARRGHGLLLNVSAATVVEPESPMRKDFLSISGSHVSVSGVKGAVKGRLEALPGTIDVERVRVLEGVRAAADDLFAHASALDRNGDEVDYLPAAKSYQAALVELANATSPEAAHAKLRLGMCLAKLGRHDEAIASFRRVLGCKTEGSELHIAQQLIAESLFAKGEHEAALAALHEAQTHYALRNEGCGTAGIEARRRFLVGVGILNEWLQRYGDAVESYLNAGGPDIHLRLVRLYDHAGRLEDLLAMPRQSDPAGSTSSLLQMVHRLLEIRQMASERDWRGLVTLVDTGGCFELEEAARLLAGHEKAALPLLLEGVEEPERAPWQEVPWGRWYALAFTRLPKAIAALKHEVAREQNYYKLQRLAAALDAAGEAGQAALRDLSVRAEGNLSVVLARNRPGPCSWESRMPYPLPEPPKRSRLPSRCEWRDDRTGYACDEPRSGHNLCGQPRLTR